MGIKVRPYCRLVPNGKAPSSTAGQSVYKFVLIASPVKVDDGNDTDRFDVLEWPRKMSELFRNGVKIVYGIGEAQGQKDATAPRLNATLASGHWDAATAAWKSMSESESDWNDLLQSVQQSLTSRSLAADFDQKIPAFDDDGLDGSGNFKNGQLDINSTLTVKAVLPVRQGDIAFAFEVERAQQVMAQMENPHTPANGQGEQSERDSVIALDPANEKDELKAKLEDFTKQTKEWKKARLNRILEATGEFRQANSAATCAPQSIPDVAASDAISTLKDKAAATHHLATWPQESKTAATMDEKSPLPSAYYAIHSSPVWSRLFAFAIDLELDVPDGLTAVACAEHDMCQDGKTILPKVWSSVDEHGWPGTEQDNSGNPGKTPLVQGVDEADAGCFPRFDLVTLDVRTIADGYSPGDGPATGEPKRTPRYATAGLTLLDRHKPFNAARQLKETTEVGNDGCTSITLHARHWTIGQKLDIAILGKENEPSWRSLMGRVGEYAFRMGDKLLPISEKNVLEPLLGTGVERGTIEETLLGSVSRLIPRASGGASDREAIVEEVISSWSGTPLAVFAGPDPDYALEQSDAAAASTGTPKGGVPKDTPLPFYQIYDLPGEKQPKSLRLPPLRYGKSYSAGLRPVFMGGGSASADAAIAHGYGKPGHCVTGQNKFRRFVRHEAINPPYVLLPSSELTDPEFPELDYSRADAVILRSRIDGNAIKDPAEALLPDINGRRYYTVDERLGRGTAVRVLVPPQVTHEELLRAGAFDAVWKDKDSLKKLQDGGLLKTAFGSASKERESDESRKNPRIGKTQGGFPSAIVQSKLAFGAEGTAYAREVGWQQDFDVAEDGAMPRGTSLFISHEKMKAYRRFAYYPDPHATTLYIRLRHRQSNVYLEGHKAVPVYNPAMGHVYPDALPTAFVFRKKERTNGLVATRIGDVVSDHKYSHFDGVQFGSRGQHVHLVEFNLASADDYEIEAFYMPEGKILATDFAVTEMASALNAKGKFLGCKGEHAHVTTGGLAVPPLQDLKSFAERILTHCRDIAPLLSISAPLEMRASHAVNRPRKDPAFADGQDSRPSDILRISPFSGEAGEGIKDYLLNGKIAFDAPSTSAIEILATCASPRNPLFDDPERGRSLKSRIAGKWKSFSTFSNGVTSRQLASVKDVYGFGVDPRTGRPQLVRNNSVRLLRIDSLVIDERVLDKDGRYALDLTAAHKAAGRDRKKPAPQPEAVRYTASQLHSFPDGKARLLRLQAFAITRFGPEFETAPRWARENLPNVRLRQPLQPLDMRRKSIGEPVEVWLKSSQRPSKCDVLTPVPAFSFVRQFVSGLGNTAGTASFKATRVSSIRVYMNRGWYSSGEGERLGLIIWPPNHLDAQHPPPGREDEVTLEHSSGSGEKRRITLTAFKDEQVGPGGAFITRWGGDPTKHDYAPQENYLMPVSAFADLADAWSPQSSNPHAPQFVSNVDVPLRTETSEPGAGSSVKEYLRCSLLTYEPCFDMDREQWYVDIRIASEATPNQFVRLGLVRFQPHAMTDNLRCSEPVTVWSQLMPARVAECSVTDVQTGGKPSARIELVIKGLAHSRVHEPEPAVDPVLYDTREKAQKRRAEMLDAIGNLHRPFMKVGVYHETNHQGIVRRNLINVLSGDATAEIYPPPNVEGMTVWTYNATLDPDHLAKLGKGQVYIYAEERERAMPTGYSVEPVKPDDMFRQDSLATSGARFEVRVDLQGEDSGK